MVVPELVFVKARQGQTVKVEDELYSNGTDRQSRQNWGDVRCSGGKAGSRVRRGVVWVSHDQNKAASKGFLHQGLAELRGMADARGGDVQRDACQLCMAARKAVRLFFPCGFVDV